MRTLASLLSIAATTLIFSATSSTAQIVPAGAQVREVVSGVLFTRGPAVDANGNLYFADMGADKTIYRLSPSGELTALLSDPEAEPIGLAFAQSGDLIVAESANGRVVQINADGSRTVLAARYEGKRFNQPTDIAVAPDGSIYFTDPFSSSMGNAVAGYDTRVTGPSQPLFGIYRIDPQGRVTLAYGELKYPSTISISPDGHTAYVSNTNATFDLKALTIQADGSLGELRTFAGIFGLGSAVDSDGNVYATDAVNERVDILSPTGKKIGSIKTPARPSDVAFSGNTLYITGMGAVWAIDLNANGTNHAATAVQAASWAALKLEMGR